MSAIIKLHGVAATEKIFVCYNFKQVKDAALLLFFAKETKQFERVFIYKNANRWETDVLRHYVDELAYDIVCKKLYYHLRQSKMAINEGLENSEHYSNFS